MVLGTYERAGVPWSPESTPVDFGHELLQPDLDRIAPSLEVAFRHFPALERAGIKRTINGPFVFAPDGNPVIGPVRGLPGYWLATGVMAGFSQGGGVGLTLAHWMVDGDPGMDVFAMDNARFGAWADTAYTHAKVQENYSRRFRITFPNEELPSGRPVRTTPVHEELDAAGAVWGATYGLEQALWFHPDGPGHVETPTFRRSDAHGPVGEEVRACRTGVGLFEASGFAKYRVTGRDAESWLDRLLAGRLPLTGRIALTPMLAENGKLRGDFTVARAEPETFYMFGSGPSENFHLRWFEAHRNGEDVTVEALGTGLVGFMLAGPRSRDLLARVAQGEVSANAFPFLSFARMTVAGAPALVGRISFTGDLGYEIWVAPEHQKTLLAELRAQGADLGLRPFGGRALNAMRLEKGYGAWLREYTVDDTPFEADLGRFVALAKGEFVGRAAAQRAKDEGAKRKLVTLLVDARDADAGGDEAVWHGGEVVGAVTSGGYGHHVDRSIALAYVPVDLARDGTEFEVEILGERRPAVLTAAAPFDPAGERLRS
jgi:dimethylglycine dehydrogenase